jgi:hypothetical protein
MSFVQKIYEATKEVSVFTSEDDAFYDALRSSVSKAAYAAVKYRLQRRKDGKQPESGISYAIRLDNVEAGKIAKTLKHAGTADKSGSEYVCQGIFSFKRGVIQYTSLRSSGLGESDLRESDQMGVFYDNLLLEMQKLGFFGGAEVIQA